MRCWTVEHVALKSWRERPGFRWRVDGSGCSTCHLTLCCGCLKRRWRQFSLTNFKIKAGFNSFYGWARRGLRGYINLFDSSLSINVIVWFSQYRFYGVIWSKKSFSSYLIIKFLNQLFEVRRTKFGVLTDEVVLVWDNVSYHKSRSVCDFLDASSLKMITIRPYQPWLNPTEKWSSRFKKKFKLYQSEGRYFKLQSK